MGKLLSAEAVGRYRRDGFHFPGGAALALPNLVVTLLQVISFTVNPVPSSFAFLALALSRGACSTFVDVVCDEPSRQYSTS